MTTPPSILIVEDDPYIARLLIHLFEMSGYDARLARSAEAAARELSVRRPDLIALDLNLPGASGQSFLRLVRRQPDTRDLPVVVITAQVPVERQVTAMAEAVVEKPFELDDLLDTVGSIAARAA